MPTKKLFFIIELVVKRAICVDISTHIARFTTNSMIKKSFFVGMKLAQKHLST